MNKKGEFNSRTYHEVKKKIVYIYIYIYIYINPRIFVDSFFFMFMKPART